MRTIVLTLLLIFIATTSHAQPTTDSSKRLNELEQLYNPTTCLIEGNLGISLEYAALLYQKNTPESVRRAETVLGKVISYQVFDRESPNHGLWGWKANGEIKDKNVPLFHAHYMLVELWEQQDKMSFKTRAAYILSCKRLIEAAERRYDEELWELGRDGIAYSNVFSLYVQTLTVAAERFGSERLQRKALTQWTRFYNYFKFYALPEFLSTTYDDIIFHALADIYRFAVTERMKEEVKEVMDYVYLTEAAVTHPLLKLPVTGISRDYRAFHKSGDVRIDFLQHPLDNYTPPAKAGEILTNRKYPFEARGKAGSNPFLYISYQLPDVAMGSMSGWGNYYWQQIHCMAAAGKNEHERATLFIPGSYTPVNGFTCQRELSALCVYNRLPTMWHLTQWRGDLAEIKKTQCDFGVGISDHFELIAQEEGKTVLRAYGYDFYLFSYQVKDGKVAPCSLSKKHRTETSPRYHRRPAVFDEFVFPEEPAWFGVFVKIVKAGRKVTRPVIRYMAKDGIHSFRTDGGHEVKVTIMEQGNSVQLHSKDVNLMPRFFLKE